MPPCQRRRQANAVVVVIDVNFAVGLDDIALRDDDVMQAAPVDLLVGLDRAGEVIGNPLTVPMPGLGVEPVWINLRRQHRKVAKAVPVFNLSLSLPWRRRSRYNSKDQCWLALRSTMEVQLRRSCLVLAVLALLSTSPALGQHSAVIAACQGDRKHICASVPPHGEQLARCVRDNFQTLSEACQAALVGVAEVHKACGADIARHCPAIKPGRGRILLCVRAHYAAMSEPCRDAIGHAAARHIRAVEHRSRVSPSR